MKSMTEKSIRYDEDPKKEESDFNQLPATAVKTLPQVVGNQAMQEMVQGRTGRHVQRQAEPGEMAAPVTARPMLIVADTNTELTPGQMRQSEFLAQLKTAVCQAADESLSGTMWSTIGCPYIERWFTYYSGQSSEHIERAIHRFAPETNAATSATEVISLATARVRQGIAQWADTGRVPTGAASTPGETRGQTGGALASLRERISGALSFKREDGGGGETADSQAVQSQLSTGQSLDGRVSQRMGSAFGADFSQVRVHTGKEAARLTNDLNARAFTVGQDVAFAPGAYQPGTPIGDALIAHELAHVLQQGASIGMPLPGPPIREDALESEADRVAVQAVINLYGRQVINKQGQQAATLARLRSGLRLSRCGRDEAPAQQGVHLDQTLSSCTYSTPKLEGLTYTADESVTREDVLTHLETIDAGGVYLFYGHGAMTKSGDFVGVNPAEGKTVKGKDIEDALKADESTPTMVVLAACGSAALLDNVANGGVPIAVGFSKSIANILAASALGKFMGELNKGKTFAEAEQVTNDHINSGGAMLGGMMNGIEIRYADGYNSGMTLQEARDKHRGP